MVVRGWSLGAVTSTAARVDGITLEFTNLVGILVHVGEKSAGGFAVETDGWDKRISPCDPLGPFLAVPFNPVIPHFRRGILANAAIGMYDLGQFDRFAT